MSKHTPGPWKFDQVLCDNAPDRLIVRQNKWGGETVADLGLYEHGNLFNARLISVAPGMLEFLQLLADYFRAGSTPLYGDGFLTSDNRPPLETIENLIRKATE